MAAPIKRLSCMAVCVACLCRGDRPMQSTEIELNVSAHDARRRAEPIPELEYHQLSDLGQKLSEKTEQIKTRVQGELTGRAQAAVKQSEDYSSAMTDLFGGLRQYKSQVTELRAKSRDSHKQHINEVKTILDGTLAGGEDSHATETDSAEVSSGGEVHESGDTEEHVDGSHDDEATRDRVREATKQELTEASEDIANGNIDKLGSLDSATNANIARLSEEESSSNDVAVTNCFGIMDDPAKSDSDRACGGELVEKCVADKPLKEVCDEEPTCQSKFVCEADGQIVVDGRGSYKVEDAAKACGAGAIARQICVTKAPMTMKLPPGA